MKSSCQIIIRSLLCILFCNQSSGSFIQYSIHSSKFSNRPVGHNSSTSKELTDKYSNNNTSLRQSSNNNYSKTTSIIIDVPQFVPNPLTPMHRNTYPSPLHKIHIQQILTKEEATQCLQIAKSHAEKTLCWSKKDSDRHSAYATADFPIDSCTELASYLDDIDFDTRIWNILLDKFDIDIDDLSFLDFFCAHYEAKDKDDDDGDDGIRLGNNGIMDRLDPHRDGSLLSFTIVLSESDSYDGGGTIFDALRDVHPNDHPNYEGVLCPNGIVRVKNPGDGVLHSGKLKHGANVVTKGERTVLVGFVNVEDRCIRDGVLKEACKEWGRCDVVQNRFKRQMNMTGHELASGWYRKDVKFVKKGSMMRNFVPAFTSVKIRGDSEKQRLQNLRAEDTLLRDILLPREDRHTASIPEHILAAFGGDITVL